MKKNSNLRPFFFILLAFTLVSSCNVDDGNAVPIPEENLIEVFQKTPTLSTLVSALERAELTATLSGAGLYTVMAPSNTAFANFLSANGYAGIEAVPVAILKQILLNHVLVGRVDAAVLSNLQRNYLETLANGPTADTKVLMYFDATSGITFNGMSKTTQNDVLASNGLIHLVDTVIDLPTLETFITVDGNFADLETALDLIAPLSSLPAMLSENGPLTLFAPAKAAFDDLLATNNDWKFLSDIDETLLTHIIEHHVVNGNIRYADISTEQPLTTLEGDDLTFYTLDGNLRIRDGSGNEGSLVTKTDIQAVNGILHIIPNKVLLPDTTN